jgi:hypothetical protein
VRIRFNIAQQGSGFSFKKKRKRKRLKEGRKEGRKEKENKIKREAHNSFSLKENT